MARKVQVVLQDDLNGGEATETVTFGLDGKTYEIDLNEKNAKALRDSLAPWMVAARRAGPTERVVDLRGRIHRSTADAADIRRWAHDNGIPVSARGRISTELRARYEAAHSSR